MPVKKRKKCKKLITELKKIRTKPITWKKIFHVANPRKTTFFKVNGKNKRNLTSAIKNRNQMIRHSDKEVKKRFQQKIRNEAVKRSKGVQVRYTLNKQASQLMHSSQNRKRLFIKKETARKCPACDGMFLNTLWCKRHIKQKHGNVVNISCPEPITLLKEESVDYCEHCGRLFHGKNAKYKLSKHKLSVHTVVKPHHCPVCDKGFVFNYLCIRHMKNCGKEDSSQILMSKQSKIQKSCEKKSKVPEPHRWPVLVQDSSVNKLWPLLVQEAATNKQCIKRVKFNRKPSVTASIKFVGPSSDLASSSTRTVLPAKMSFKLNNKTSQKELSCPKCDKVFSGPHSSMCFRTHYFTHISVSRYTCSICSKGFVSHFRFHQHYREMHRDSPVLPAIVKPQVTLCMKCFQVFTGPDATTELSDHVIIHRTPKTHVCVECDRKFACKVNLINHIKKIHGMVHSRNQEKSEKGQQESCKERQVLSNEQSSKIERCLENTTKKSVFCHRRFQSKTYSMEHQETDHVFDVVEGNFDTLVYLCSCCNQRFETKSELEEHLKTCPSVQSQNYMIRGSGNNSASSSVNNIANSPMGEEINALSSCSGNSDACSQIDIAINRILSNNFNNACNLMNEKVNDVNRLQVEPIKVQLNGSMSAIVKTEIDFDSENGFNGHNSNVHEGPQVPSKHVWKPNEGDLLTTADKHTPNIIQSSSCTTDKSIEQCRVYTGLSESDEEIPTIMTSKEQDITEKFCEKCNKIFKGPNAFALLMKHRATHWTVKLGQLHKKSSEHKTRSSNDLYQSDDEPELAKPSQHLTSRNINKIRTCSDCGLRFLNFSLLLNHKKIIHHHIMKRKRKRIAKIRRCNKCNQVFNGPNASVNLSRHKLTHWSGKGELQSVIFASQLEPNDSIVQPSDQKLNSKENTRRCDRSGNLFTCQDCGKEYSSGYQLQNHLEKCHLKQTDCRSNNVVRSYSCKLCCAVYNIQAGLKRHILVHECQDKVFTCTHCGWVFFTRSSLYLHKWKQHKNTIRRRTNKPYLVKTGEKMGKNLETIKNLQVSVRTNVAINSEADFSHNNHTSVCDPQSSVVSQHSNKNSDLIGTFQTLPRSNRKISTAHLSSSYDYEQIYDNDLQRTILESSNEYQETLSSKHDSLFTRKSNSASVANKLHTCPDCGRGFTFLHSLKRHALLVHKKNLYVKDLSKSADSGQNKTKSLNNYTKRVTRKKFGCSDELSVRHCKKCNMVFEAPYAYMKLWRHMHTHSQVLPYTCTDCSKGFVFLNHFKAHMKNIHGKVNDFSNLRVNSCTECTATFSGEEAKKLLRNHMITHRNVARNLVHRSRTEGNDNVSSVNTMETLQSFPDPKIAIESIDTVFDCIDLTSENGSEHSCNTFQDKPESSRRDIFNSDVAQETNMSKNLPKKFKMASRSNRRISTAHLSSSYDYGEMCDDSLQKDRNAFNHYPITMNSPDDSLAMSNLNSESVETMPLATKSHVCPDCGHKFQSKQSYQMHALRIHKKNTDNPSNNAQSGMGLKQKSLLKHYKKISLNSASNQRRKKVDERHCTKCDKVYVGRYAYDSLWFHMHSHSLAQPYTCPDCGAGFVYPGMLEAHMQRLHGKVIDCRSLRISSCDQCDAKFTGRNGGQLLREHMLTHKNICPPACEYCGSRFVSDCSLRNHIKRRHSSQTDISATKESVSKPFVINSTKRVSMSDYKQTNTDKFVQQLPDSIIIIKPENEESDCIDLTNENERDYCCNTGTSDFMNVHGANNELRRRESLQSHNISMEASSASRLSEGFMYEHNKTDTYEQTSLKAVNKFPVDKFKQTESLFRWQLPKMGGLNEKYHTCLECGLSFNFKSMLKIHRSLHHPRIARKTTKEDQRAETCDKCNTVFVGHNAAAMLSKHYLMHNIEFSTTSDASTRFNCSECGFGCNLNIRLNIHLKNVHSDKLSISSEGEIMTSNCDQCNVVFKGPNSSSMMSKHKLYHHKLIDVKVKKSWNLKFSGKCCEICCCTFQNPNAFYYLQQHMYWHFQIKPYTCDKCNKEFLFKFKLKSHINRAHGIIIENNNLAACCTLCKAVFIKSSVQQEVSMFWKHMVTHKNISVRNCSSCTNKRSSSGIKQSNRVKEADESKKYLKTTIEADSNFKVMDRHEPFKNCVKPSKHLPKATKPSSLKNNAIDLTDTQVKSCTNYSNDKEDGIIDKQHETSSRNEVVIHSSPIVSGMRLRHNLPSWIFSHYSCDICRIRFASKFRLNKHNKLFHENHTQNDQSGSARWPVNVFNKVADTSKVKTDKQHKKRRDFQESEVNKSKKHCLKKCKICRKTFLNRNLLLKHIRTHGIHNCKTCDRKFPIKKLLRKHMLTNKCAKYLCNTCLAPFTSEVALQAHARLHKCRNFETGKGHFYVRKKSNLKVYRNLTRHACSVCNREFREKATLRGHTRLHETELQSHEVAIAIEEVFECLSCKRAFSSKSLLVAHLRIFADQEVMASTDNLVVPNAHFPVGDPEFMCAYCLLEFFTQEEAKEHFIHTICQKKAEEDN